MVQIIRIFLVVAILVFPVLCLPVQVNERELVARDLGLGKSFRRELDNSLDVRDLIDEFDFRDLSGEELDARDPGLGFRRDLEDMIARGLLYEELAPRGVLPELEMREMPSEDLVAREPHNRVKEFFRRVGRAIKGAFTKVVNGVSAAFKAVVK